MKKMKSQGTAILSVIACIALVFCIVIVMTLKNTNELRGIIQESVKSQLISISIAARDMLDIDRFAAYKSLADTEADSEAYEETLANLRFLQQEVGAQYIYALKEIDGKYYFIFDTDTEEKTTFFEYEPSAVHVQAFLGQESAGVMNVVDEFGSFNTGAVPIRKDGNVIGIISADIEDTYMAQSEKAARINAISLIVTMLIALGIMTTVIAILWKRSRKMQEKLFRMANYDVLTGLPNRQYLMEYLAEIAGKGGKAKAPFALLFIDLDNFKKVNDNAGHDAGDELLRHISAYLGKVHAGSQAFRPTAGLLNVSARIGGDEFVQVVPSVETAEQAAAAAKMVLDQFDTKTLSRYVQDYQVGLSIGVALYPYHSDDYNVLIKYADIAMYHAKKNGKNNYFVYSDGMQKE